MISKSVFGLLVLAVTLVTTDAWSAPTCAFKSTPQVAPRTAAEEKALAKAVLDATTDDDRQRALRSLQQSGAVVLHTVTLSQRERVSIALANPPSSRLRLSFDSTSGGHHEVEWDPAVAGELMRVVQLEGPANGGTRTWNISASVEAATYTQSAGTVIIHTRFGGFAAGSTTMIGTYTALAATVAAAGVTADRDLSGWPAPALTFSCDSALSVMDEETFPAAGGTQAAGLRGFGVAPTFVTDTLSLLTEIAIDRAKSGAMNVLKKRLVDPFCVNSTKISLARLKLGVSDELALPRTCGVLTSLRLGDILSSGRPLLFALRDDLRYTIAPAAVAQLTSNNGPATAALGVGLSILNTAIDHGGFDGLEGQLALSLLGRFEQLAPSLNLVAIQKIRTEIEGVLSAARASDLVDVVENTVGLPKCPALIAIKANLDAPGMADDVKTAVTACLGEFKEWFAKRLVGSLGDWALPTHPLMTKVTTALVTAVQSDAASKLVVSYACQARLVVAVVKRCSKQGCSASEIVDMVSTPSDFFAPDTALPAAVCWNGTSYVAPEGEAASIAELVLQGLRLVAPLVDGRGRDRAKAAVKLIVNLVQRWQVAPGNRNCACLDTFTEIAVSLIDEDYGTALGRLVRLAEQVQPARIPVELRKLAQLVGAVATYASVYQATKDDDPKAARDARKQALSTIIDDATDRSQWEGSPIFSIGSNVGISLTWVDQYAKESGDSVFDPGLRVPLGLGIDAMRGKDSYLGLHVGIQLADLGQFVRRGTDNELDEVEWADFVSPGLEVGVLLAFIDPRLNLTFHAAYAPSLTFVGESTMDSNGTVVPGETTDGVWRYGVSLAYYVPFFDLN